MNYIMSYSYDGIHVWRYETRPQHLLRLSRHFKHEKYKNFYIQYILDKK